MTNPDTTASFTGSIPENYHKFLGPILFEFSGKDMAQRVADKLETQGDILEIACGTAISTKHIAGAVPDGSTILATDLNDAMLEIAARENGDLPGVTYQQADAMALLLPDDCFDSVICQFGIMFLPDRVAGLREMHRVLKPGGWATVTTWDSLSENPAMEIAASVIKAAFDSDPPRFLEVPFGMYDIAEIQEQFRAAGFPVTEATHVTEMVETQDLSELAKGAVTGNPNILEIENRGTASAEDIIAKIQSELRAEFGPDPAKVPFREITFQAQKPMT